MTADGICVLITPSAPGAAWREALTLRAVQLAWPVRDAQPGDDLGVLTGLVFTASHTVMAAFPPSARVALIDTTAADEIDPAQPASAEAMVLRSHALIEAETAVKAGAVLLDAARYLLEFPILGQVERREGSPYRIHPSVAESPLAFFNDTMPGASANWHPRWFAYPDGHMGTVDHPVFDLTGRMRPLISGPHIGLPAGRWRVDLRFTVDPERAHAPLLFEWGSGSEFSRVMTEVRHPGTYAASLDRIWLEPAPAQLRIWPGHPVFQGVFGFLGARVTRIALDDPAPPTPTDRIVQASVA